MGIKLSKDIINSRLLNRKIELIGEYLGTHHKTEFRCEYNHQWISDTHSILAGAGCPICRYSLVTMDNINLELEKQKRPIRMISEYDGPEAKSEFKCFDGHVWQALPRKVIKETSCPHCKIEKTISFTKKRILDDLSKKGIELVGEYINSKTKTTFRCTNGHIWESRPDAVSCPSCANHGFDPSKIAWTYAFVRDYYIKYGITNNLEQRLNQHRRNGEIILIHSQVYEQGISARKWEIFIQDLFGKQFATKEKCPDGWTETFSIDKLEHFLQAIEI